VVQIADANTRESVWIAGEGERLDDFREMCYRGVDLGNLGAGGEPEFDERLYLASGHPMVEKHRVAPDQAYLFQTINPAFGGRRRESHESSDLTG
jgi:hypothetical protein